MNALDNYLQDTAAQNALVEAVVETIKNMRPDLDAYVDEHVGTLYVRKKDAPDTDPRAIYATPFWNGDGVFEAQFANDSAANEVVVKGLAPLPWTGYLGTDALMWAKQTLPLVGYLEGPHYG